MVYAVPKFIWEMSVEMSPGVLSVALLLGTIAFDEYAPLPPIVPNCTQPQPPLCEICLELIVHDQPSYERAGVDLNGEMNSKGDKSEGGSMPSPQQRFERFYRTLRLTFGYESDTISFIGRNSVEMLTPPPATTPIREGQSGFWYELRDHDGHILYQRAIHNPVRFEVEHFPEDQKEPIRRSKVQSPRGTFDLLVPDVPEGETVVLFASPLEPQQSMLPARELARFSVKQDLKSR